MNKLDHPGVMKLEEVFYGTSVVYLIMELCNVLTDYYER
jgi:hypothetical protein